MVSSDAPSLSTEYRKQGWWRDETFLDDLRRQARERPHKVAIAGRRIAESRTDTLDYAELTLLTDRFAGALVNLGVKRGDFVAVQLPNRWEMVPLIFACLAVGTVICPISPICPEAELEHRLGLTGARVCITIPQWEGLPLADLVIGLRPRLPELDHVVVMGGAIRDDATDFEKHFVNRPWEAEPTTSTDGLALSPDEPCVVLFTSGTTGESKGVLHSQNSLYGAVQGYVCTFGLDEHLVAAVSTPLCHYSGFVQGVLVGVLVGGTTAFQDVKDNALLLDLVERHGATLLYGPPATLVAVRDTHRADPHDVSTLRQAVIGSAPVLPQLVADLRSELGVRAYSLWGMSEYGPVTMTRPTDDADLAGSSNGRPIAGMQLRIVPLVPGDSDKAGRLWVRGAAQSLGYYKRNDVFAAHFDEDGWFDTGDLARQDGHGGIRIICRASDAIVRGGQIVPVVEIEAVMESHPQVLEAALVALPDASDQVICAVVALCGDAPSLEDLRDHLQATGLPSSFLPDRAEVLDALPRTLTGKIRKAQLRHHFTHA